MTKFKKILNPVTGKIDLNFPAVLKSVGTKTFEYENAQGVKNSYVLGTIDFTYPNGKPALGVTTQIFSKSLSHGMKIGDSLLSTMSQGESNALYVRTSHLVNGGSVSIDDFDMSLFEADVVGTPAVGATA